MLPDFTRATSVAFAMLALSAASSYAQQGAVPPRPSLRVGALRGVLELDGLLTESDWVSADSIADLTQIEPVEGATPQGRTVVRVIASGESIVLGVVVHHASPADMVSFARARDASLGNEDHVRFILDTYLDGRSGYVFAINPNGARYDALITDGGDDENSNWDAVWDAAAVRTATGWSAEVRIPLKSLLFRRGLSEWGFNVQRRVQRLQETDRWATPERDYKITQTSRAGLLTELPPFDLGVGLSVRPSVTASGAKPGPGASITGNSDVSLDATQRIGSNTLASLTVNTDFAETEVDTRRTNLTRFSISFPEKRTFFLEGSDIFDFGQGLGDVRPFFSRRIGLLASEQVPLNVGGKINGRLGNTNFGALVARTGRVDSLPSDNTMGVVRVRQNVFRESSIGMIATTGDPQGRSGSWLSGADFTYQTSAFRGDKNLIAGVWGLATDRDGLTGRRNAFGGILDFPNDLLEASVTYRWVGDGFQPSLGFVPRPGVQVLEASVNFKPRPSRPIAGLRVRQMFHELETEVVLDLDGRWESYQVFTAPINWRLESGDRFELNVVPVGERLLEAFEIADGVEIPAGSYHWNRYRVEAGLATKRRFAGQFSWWFGDFYTGTLDEFELTASWKPSALLSLELSAERNIGRLAEGAFTQDLVGTRLRVNVSPDLQVNSVVQYDNESESFGANTRLRWTFSPLGDLFVVYNHNLTALDQRTRERRLAFESNQLLIKVQYAFRY